MALITYDDKDNSLPTSNPRRLFRDVDANEIKSVVNANAALIVNHFRGAYDLSVNAYPSSGGTGASGVPGIGDHWYVSVPGAVDVTGLGTITLEVNALLFYKGGTVTNASSWIVKQ